VAPVAFGRFSRALVGAERIGLDTAVLIYQLEDVSPYVQLTTHLLTNAAMGRTQLLVSAISVAEILAGPWKAGDESAARRIEESMRALPGLVVADMTFDAASRAARLRGQTNLPLADSLILASVMQRKPQLIVTNDAAWRVKGLPFRVLVLEDYV